MLRPELNLAKHAALFGRMGALRERHPRRTRQPKTSPRGPSTQIETALGPKYYTYNSGGFGMIASYLPRGSNVVPFGVVY